MMKHVIAFLFGILVCTGAYAANVPLSIPTVPNIAALRSLGAAAPQYPTIQVLGYSAAGDGGGGLFTWASASTATAEPCITFQATGVSTGRWVRSLGSLELSLLMCGVKADSSTDNSVPLQAAFNAISTYNLGEIYCPATAGTIKFGTAISPVSGGSLRGQNNTINQALGISGSAPGACHFVYTAASGWAFDYQTPFQTIAACPSTPGIKFYNLTLEQASSGNGFRINTTSTAGFTDSCVADGGGQSVVTGNVFDGIVTNSAARSTTAIQVNKGFDTTITNSFFTFYDTQVDVEGSDNVLLFNNKFNFATLREVDLQSRGTFGNFNTVRDNTFFTPYINASDFLRSSARSGVIDGNYYEADFTGITNVLNITCGLAQTITNNAMELLPANVTNWLSVTGDCTGLIISNNYNGGGGSVPSVWNAGAGSHWVANTTKQKIFAYNNPDNNVQTPFITAEPTPISNNAPAISGSILASFDSSSNQGIGGNYASTITIGNSGHAGDFRFTTQSGSNGHVTFTFQQPITGAIDLWALAYTGAGSNQVLTIGDGVTTTNTTLSGGTTPTWYKVISNDTVINPTIDTVNHDTAHGQDIYITRWQAVVH